MQGGLFEKCSSGAASEGSIERSVIISMLPARARGPIAGEIRAWIYGVLLTDRARAPFLSRRGFSNLAAATASDA